MNRGIQNGSASKAIVKGGYSCWWNHNRKLEAKASAHQFKIRFIILKISYFG